MSAPVGKVASIACQMLITFKFQLRALANLVKSKPKPSLTLLGPYSTYAEALRHSSGYDHPVILDKVRDAVSSVLTGKSAYERDGTIFSELPPRLAIRSELQRCIGRQSLIVDYGGGLGGLFVSNSDLFIDAYRLVVIEQDKWVEAGNRLHAQHHSSVEFVHSLNEVEYSPDVLIFSSVLMYIPDIDLALNQVSRLMPRHIIIDRTAFTSSSKDEWFVQFEPTYYGIPISYPFKPISRYNLLSQLSEYRIVSKWRNSFDADIPPHRGLHLVRKH